MLLFLFVWLDNCKNKRSGRITQHNQSHESSGSRDANLLQTSPQLAVEDVPLRVLGQEVEQQLGLYLGQPSTPVGGDALLEVGPRDDTLAVRIEAFAQVLELPHHAVEIGVVKRVQRLARRGGEWNDQDGWRFIMQFPTPKYPATGNLSTNGTPRYLSPSSRQYPLQAQSTEEVE